MTYLLLYNPVSGKGKFKKKIPKLEAMFREKGLSFDCYESQFAKDLEEKSYQFAPQYDVFLVAGGDGTINEVLNGVMKSEIRPKLVILPSGTANDIASILGVTKNYQKTLDLITTEPPVRMDVNKLNSRYFLYATAAGVLTRISYDIPRKTVKRYGYFAYLWYGVKDFFKTYKMNVTVEYDQGTIQGNYMLILGLTAKRVGGFTLRKFSEAKVNDGHLELRLVKFSRGFKLFKLLFFFLFSGKKGKSDIHLSSTKYRICSQEVTDWNTDGEGIQGSCVEMSVEKQAIEVYASLKAKKKYF